MHWLRGVLKEDQQTPIAEISHAYGEAYSKHRRQRAENPYLKPIGLDANEFLNRHCEWSEDFIERTTRQMQNFQLDEETIIAGSDPSGHHIYVIGDPGDVRCDDSIGFAR